MAHSGLLGSVETVVARVLSPAAWMDTGAGFLQLFSGVTSALHFSGPIDPRLAMVSDLIAIAALVLSIAVGWKTLRTARPPWGLWLLGAVGIGLAGYHVVAGPQSLRPGFERYATCLIVPVVILYSVALDALNPHVADLGCGADGDSRHHAHDRARGGLFRAARGARRR